jgi:hypothetical protein
MIHDERAAACCIWRLAGHDSKRERLLYSNEVQQPQQPTATNSHSQGPNGGLYDLQ